VPEDQVCVRLLLISGLKTDLLFNPTDSIETVKRRIFDAWPSDWTGETPETVANLRILLRGKFLEPATTLSDAKFPLGQTTTCHLLVKN
ncbi:ubiquitin-2 like Rad60 SUMO-like-domain-containing protein, partial [Obelidium mucronatum]